MSEANHATHSITSTANNGQCVQVVSEMKCEDLMLELSKDEEDLVARMFRLVGNRWSLIAGRIPGRTAEEIEKYWTSKFASPSDQCSSCA